jgi:hypothetical protein
MGHELMYCVVKTPHVWCVIVYQQFHNYDGVIFLYCHASDSNYRLPFADRYRDISVWIYPFSIDRILSAVFRF